MICQWESIQPYPPSQFQTSNLPKVMESHKSTGVELESITSHVARNFNLHAASQMPGASVSIFFCF